MVEWLQFPDEVSLLTGWSIVALAMVTAMIGAMFGLGGGTILLAAMAILLPPVAVIPVHGVIQIGANSGRALLMFRHIRYRPLLPFAIGTGLGSIASGLMIFEFPPWTVQYLVAAFILWSVFGKMPPLRANHIVGAGAFSGFLTVLVGATGPFVSAFVKAMSLPRLNHVATHAAMMTLQHGLKIAVFGFLGFAFGPYVFLIIMMLLSGFAGTAIGRILLGRMRESTFRPWLSAILVLLALRLIWQATDAALGA
jgi:uncharacterized membrane protein YfcA